MARSPKSGAQPTYDPKYAGIGKRMCLLGATDEELGYAFGVTRRTIVRWRVQYPRFAASTRAGKRYADERVKRALFERAVGYDFTEEELFQHRGKIIRATRIKHVPPDVTACLKWLFNRRPEEWRDRSELLSNSPDVASALKELAEKLPE